MNLHAIKQHKFYKPIVGALVVAIISLMFWQTRWGEVWAEASYDYLFRFGAREVTNQVALILLDDAAYAEHRQVRGQPWDRALHASLLNKLANDGAALVVFDMFFRSAGNSETDTAFAAAMRKHRRVVLMAETTVPQHQATGSDHLEMEGVQTVLPYKLFLDVALDWGIGKAAANLGRTPRRHWPFPASTSSIPSLAWAAARSIGTILPEEPVEQWLRYYRENGPWARFSYHHALTQPPGYFTNFIVFVGNDPDEDDPAIFEKDKFASPYTRWNGKAVGGVTVIATTFLNLTNHEWLRRPAPWVEAMMLLVSGLLLGAIPFLVRPAISCSVTVTISVSAMIGTVLWSYFGSFWFPWLIVSGAQAPCALIMAMAKLRRSAPQTGPTGTELIPVQKQSPRDRPDAPDYSFFAPAFGKGAFGKVWLVRNAVGQWQALKAVYQAKFGENTKPYEAEFNGIQQYKPISNQHLGLLTVDFVSTQKVEGYFYYVMELGDSRVPDWESRPEVYLPLDLEHACVRLDKNRLPLSDCVSIGIVLADALAFLHDQELTHRDIKPQNIIFVKGQPKLADVGLVTPARRPEDVTTYAGTPGYMPPYPEPPGTKSADIYALGMVLFVISTGSKPMFFPDLKTSLVVDASNAEFMFLNRVILRACNADLNERFSSAHELREALAEVERRVRR